MTGDGRTKSLKFKPFLSMHAAFFVQGFVRKGVGEGRHNKPLTLVGAVTCGGDRSWWQRRLQREEREEIGERERGIERD